MSVVLLLRCDAMWPTRTPVQCTAYRPIPALTAAAVAQATADGWQVRPDGRAVCPSCTRLQGAP